MKLHIQTIFLALAASVIIAGCGEQAGPNPAELVETEVEVQQPSQEKAVAVDPEVKNEGLYDLKSSINSVIGDSIEEDIRDAVENQMESGAN